LVEWWGLKALGCPLGNSGIIGLHFLRLVLGMINQGSLSGVVDLDSVDESTSCGAAAHNLTKVGQGRTSKTTKSSHIDGDLVTAQKWSAVLVKEKLGHSQDTTSRTCRPAAQYKTEVQVARDSTMGFHRSECNDPADIHMEKSHWTYEWLMQSPGYFRSDTANDNKWRPDLGHTYPGRLEPLGAVL
jgi:hypothetical protein